MVIGSGGREYSLVAKLKKSPILGDLYCIPGSDAIHQMCGTFDCNLDGNMDLIMPCKERCIDLVIVGSEQYLKDGIADKFREEKIHVIGPGHLCAELEYHKSFARDFCDQYSIPVPRYSIVANLEAAIECIKTSLSYPIVIKRDALAAGKGVFIVHHEEEALRAIESLYKDGDNETLVIEDFVCGEEFSMFALVNGLEYISFGCVKDYKRISTDSSVNTGGMGSISYHGMMSNETHDMYCETFVKPVINGFCDLGMKYSGILYPGIMSDSESISHLLEYNVRFGDPETQVLMERIDVDLLSVFVKALSGEMSDFDGKIPEKKNATICVVLASRGYPGHYEIGAEILGLDKAANIAGVKIVHAGTKLHGDKWCINGGRVLNIVASADSLNEAREKAYAAVKEIYTDPCDSLFYRDDIGA